LVFWRKKWLRTRGFIHWFNFELVRTGQNTTTIFRTWTRFFLFGSIGIYAWNPKWNHLN
jgi:hypothetical protein